MDKTLRTEGATAVMKTQEVRQVILDLATRRGPKKSLCPSEVARRICPEDWRTWMPAVREEAAKLVDEGLIVVLQRGREVDLATVRGPIRLRISRRHERS